MVERRGGKLIQLGAAALLAATGAGCNRGPQVAPINPDALKSSAIFSLAKAKPTDGCTDLVDGKRVRVRLGEPTASGEACVGGIELEAKEHDNIVPVSVISSSRDASGAIHARLITADGQFITKPLEFVVGSTYKFVDGEGNEYSVSPGAVDGSIVNENPVKVATPNPVGITTPQSGEAQTSQTPASTTLPGQPTSTPNPNVPTPSGHGSAERFDPQACYDSFGDGKPGVGVSYDDGTGGGKWICTKNMPDGYGKAFYEFRGPTGAYMFVIISIANPSEPLDYGDGQVVQNPVTRQIDVQRTQPVTP